MMLVQTTSQNDTFARGLRHPSAAGQPHGWPVPISPAEPAADRVRVLAWAAVVGQHTALQPSLHRNMLTLSNSEISSKERCSLFGFPDPPPSSVPVAAPPLSLLPVVNMYLFSLLMLISDWRFNFYISSDHLKPKSFGPWICCWIVWSKTVCTLLALTFTLINMSSENQSKRRDLKSKFTCVSLALEL